MPKNRNMELLDALRTPYQRMKDAATYFKTKARAKAERTRLRKEREKNA